MATAAELEARWAARVRADREQVERLRELDEGSDFYAPVAHTFVDDPDRTDDPVLDAILDLVQPADRWLDIGAGGGRYALPIARRAREVVAIDPSPRMRETLRAAATEFGIDNVTVVDGRWPMGEGAPTGDGALMAHVGYDIEHIGPFLDAAESAARRCVAVLMDRSPPSAAAALWPPVHGEERVELPALDDLVRLLRARGRRPRVRTVPRVPPSWEDDASLQAAARRQLWVQPGSVKDERLSRAIAALAMRSRGRLQLPGGPRRIGIVDWAS
jgi:SAM-dependent methyltransferase